MIESYTRWARDIWSDARQEWLGNVGYTGELLDGVLRVDDEYAKRETSCFSNATLQILTSGCVNWQRVPNDIMASIFHRYLDDAAKPVQYRRHTPREGLNIRRLRAPFVLAMVCRAWRYAALDTPLLWTFMGVPAFKAWPQSDKIGPAQSNAMLRLTNRWLYLASVIFERSRNAPLDVYILQFFAHDPDECGLGLYRGAARKGAYGLHAKFLALLGGHAHRIRSIYMCPEVDPVAVWERLGARGQDYLGEGDPIGTSQWDVHLPQLQILQVRRRLALPKDLLDSRMSRMMLHAPRLESMHLEGAPQLLPAPGTSPLRLEIIDNAQIMVKWLWPRVEACATSLVHLHVYIQDNRPPGREIDGPDTNAAAIIVLASLKSFILEYSMKRDPELVSLVMHRLQMPSLRTAAMVTVDSQIGCLELFLQNIQPDIRSLEIKRSGSTSTSTSLTQQQAVKICTRFKQLWELSLEGCRVDPSFQLVLDQHKPGFRVEQTASSSWKYEWEG
ncbi:hypothetical protein BKA62DRAFT_833071 [Auriculariales sp. MPI-PUGE-AT-0066]|nr:hypothetical protein BKA62DRAFT_833071 [Auriculariales sp. MPI-PUGE-AT-0066]